MNEAEQRHDVTPSPESEVKTIVSPVVARLALSAVDASYLDPATASFTEDHRNKFNDATPDKIAYKSIINASMESRAAAEKISVQDWNEKFWQVTKATIGEDVEESTRSERLAAYESLGLDNLDEENHAAKVDAFRQKYVPEDGSNIKEFIQDIADKCKNDDGTVNLSQLTTRLDAIKPLLNIFGTENKVNDLVKDFATTHGILSQSQELKIQLINEAVTHIAKPLENEDQINIKLLWEAYQQPDIPSPGEQEAEKLKVMSEIGRELSKEEMKIITDGGGADDVKRFIVNNVKNNILYVQAEIRGENVQNPRPPEQVGTLPLQSEYEVNAAFEMTGVDESMREHLFSDVKPIYEKAKELGIIPYYVLDFKSEGKPDKPPLAVVISGFEEGVNEEKAISELQEFVKNQEQDTPKPPDTTKIATPPEPPAEIDPSKDLNFAGRRIKVEDKYYTELKEGPDGVKRLRGDDGEIIEGDKVKELIDKSEPDIIQPGKTFIHKPFGEKFVLQGVSFLENEPLQAIFTDSDGEPYPIPLSDLRDFIKAGRRWEVAEEVAEESKNEADESGGEEVNELDGLSIGSQLIQRDTVYGLETIKELRITDTGKKVARVTTHVGDRELLATKDIDDIKDSFTKPDGAWASPENVIAPIKKAVEDRDKNTIELPYVGHFFAAIQLEPVNAPEEKVLELRKKYRETKLNEGEKYLFKIDFERDTDGNVTNYIPDITTTPKSEGKPETDTPESKKE